MAKPVESTERAALVTLGDELARTHVWRVLSYALELRLGLDNHRGLPTILKGSVREEANGPITDSGRFATALVGKLRVDGRGEVADALVSLLSGGPIDYDPMLWLNEVQAKSAGRREAAAALRARGRHEVADLFENTVSLDLRVALNERLHADGRHDLADAISAAIYTFEDRERGDEEPPAPSPVAARKYEPPPEAAALWTLGDKLGRTHPADVLAYALIAKLRSEGRDVLAGSIMMFWARDVAGPIVDPARLATDLIAQLRTEGRGELADTIASLLRGVSIDRDPCEIMAIWLNELAGPIVDPGPLTAALVAALRKRQHGELADGVERLLSAS